MILLDHHFLLPTKHTPFSIFPFACVHEDNPGHSASKWQEFLCEVKTTKHALAIGLGDYMDWLRTHARDFLKLYPNETDHSFRQLHDYRRKAADLFCEKYLDGIRDKLVGLSLGNHHHDFGDGLNDVMYMCQQLKVPYLGKGFFIRLNCYEADRATFKSLRIYGHHGEGVGGGATMGGDVNAMENKGKGVVADIYLMAHNHKKHGFHTEPITIPRRGKLSIVSEPKAFIRAGCFVKGYIENCVSYAEAKQMNPTAIGYVRLDVKFKEPYNKEAYQEAKSRGAKNPTRVGQLQYEFKVTY